MGNFTLPLAKRAAEVVGVEGVAELVAKGQENAQQNGLHNVTFFHENLEEDVTKQPWASRGFDKVLLGITGDVDHPARRQFYNMLHHTCRPRARRVE